MSGYCWWGDLCLLHRNACLSFCECLLAKALLIYLNLRLQQL